MYAATSTSVAAFVANWLTHEMSILCQHRSRAITYIHRNSTTNKKACILRTGNKMRYSTNAKHGTSLLRNNCRNQLNLLRKMFELSTTTANRNTKVLPLTDV
ncbi:hypothetical protein Tcan_00789, partial [Toxocara canis]